jgi:hypothetical protein
MCNKKFVIVWWLALWLYILRNSQVRFRALCSAIRTKVSHGFSKSHQENMGYLFKEGHAWPGSSTFFLITFQYSLRMLESVVK